MLILSGNSSRMGGVNKQFLEINDIPVIVHTIKVFENSDLIDELEQLILDLQKNYYKELEEKRLAKLKKKLSQLVKKEEELTAKLPEGERELFLKYTDAYNEFSSISICDSFISGFRLGAKFAYNTFVD